MTNVETQFIDRSRAFLTRDYLPKIRACVAELSAADLWWRPNPNSNSIAHLMLHLAGNIRQWIVSGLGGEEDTRERHLEFDPEERPEADTLVENLASAVSEADAVLADLDPQILSSQHVIQGMSTTGLGALYHVVEHFSMHTGQIVYVTKLRTGKDLAFYRELEGGIALAQWPGHDDSLG